MKIFSVVPRGRLRGDGHKLKCRKIHLNVREKKFIVGQTLEQVAQRGCSVSVLEVLKTGHIPEQPAGWPSPEQGVGLEEVPVVG